MGGNASDTFAHLAGYGVGALSALTSIKGGGLQNYFLNRQRAIEDPAIRASLVGSPFASGMFLQSGSDAAAPGAMPAAAASAEPGRAPAAATVAAPSDVVWLQQQNPSRRFLPGLPPLPAETQVQVQAAQGIVSGLQSADPVVRAQAKLAGKVPLTPEEQTAVIHGGQQLQGTLGQGSTVGIQLPGMPVQIGSPYNIAPLGEEEFPTPEQAIAASNAHGWGGRIGPTVHGGWKPIPPPSPAETLPPPPGAPTQPGPGPAAPGGATGPVIRGTVRSGIPPTPGGPSPNAVHPQAFVQGMVDRGWTSDESAAAAGNAHVESAFLPGNVNKTGGDSGLIQWTGARKAGLMNYANATGRAWTDPSVQMDWLAMERSGDSTKYGGSDERAAYSKAFGSGGTAPDLAEGFGRYVERPARLHDTLADRRAYAGLYAPTQVAAATPAPTAALPAPPAAASPSGIFSPSTAYAAEVPPGATVQQPTAGFDRDAVVPHVVVQSGDAGGAVGYPSPAPAVSTAVPPLITVRPPAPERPATGVLAPPVTGAPQMPAPAPVLPGIPTEPKSGQPLESETHQYTGGVTQSYHAPPRGSTDEQGLMRWAGITDMYQATPEQLKIYNGEKRFLAWQERMDSANAARISQSPSEVEKAQTDRLHFVNSAVADLESDPRFDTPEKRAHYVGWSTYPTRVVEQHLNSDDAKTIADFRRLIAPLALSTFEPDGKNPLSGPDLQYLAPLALNPYDATQFEANLQGLRDVSARQIAFHAYISGLARDNPAALDDPRTLQYFNDQYRQAQQQQSAAPAPAAPPQAAPQPATPPPTASRPWAPTATWPVQ